MNTSTTFTYRSPTLAMDLVWEELWVKLMCGGVASATAKTIFAPLERVKLLLQTQKANMHGKEFTGVFQILREVPKTQGISGLWRGNFMNCLRIFPTYAFRFVFYDFYQNILPPNGTFHRQLLTAGLSGGTVALFTHPLDVIRTRMAAETWKSGKGILSTFTSTTSKEGFSGLYKGLTPALLDIVPYVAITLGGYDFFKQTWGQDSGFGSKFFAAYCSGVCASLVCYPFDTLKRMMMLRGADGFKDSSHERFIRFSSHYVKENGISYLYKGVLVNAFKSAPALATTLILNDKLRELQGLS